MIQRIQSIYLLLVSVLMLVAVMSPLILLSSTVGNILEMKGLGIYEGSQIIYPTWGIFSIGLLVALISLITLFSYKTRKRQISLSVLNIFLIFFFYITAGVYIYSAQQSLGVILNSVAYGAILPVIAFIFNVLALIGIRKDEKLVRSLDRIR